jgi:hypothetical protein
MIQIECVLTRLTSRIGVPAFAVQGREQVLHDVFAHASNQDIQLGVNNALLAAPAGDQRGFWALDLHLALQAVTNNTPPGPVGRIGVLFADYYKPFPAALGVMFDRGFDPGDDPSSARAFRQLPREGCAIFLGAIRDFRTASASQAEAEAFFTTIHELGHVFNLQHVNHPQNFMSQSVAVGPYNPSAYRFLAGHEEMLASCSHSPHVWPGGKPFADTGPFAHHSVPSSRRRAPPAFGLELSLEMAQREFWDFEPVELDVELRVAGGVSRSFRVPDAIDPGYEIFTLWIEEPSGERRRYRSPRRYCSSTKTRRISPAKPFRRDISIFGEAGGYTFRRTGIHRIWAEFQPRPEETLRSNTLEVLVRPASVVREYRLAKRVLASSPRAKILYHRLLRHSRSRDLSILTSYAAANPCLNSRGSLQYAVARALHELGPASIGVEPQTVRSLLERALDGPLGMHQRATAEALLGKQPRSPAS